jgi:ADP-ribose pyrophosphatase
VSEFERIGGETMWTGRIIRAGVEEFRHSDGETVVRDKVWHPGAVGVLAFDEESVWLTRQPREAAGVTASLEVPAGKLDVPGEPPLETAKRELVEEIGKRADHWEMLFEFWTSPGFSDERVWLFVAQGLSDAEGGAAPEEDERIEVVRWPLADLDGAISACDDSKSLIALLWLKTQLSGRSRPPEGE